MLTCRGGRLAFNRTPSLNLRQACAMFLLYEASRSLAWTRPGLTCLPLQLPGTRLWGPPFQLRSPHPCPNTKDTLKSNMTPNHSQLWTCRLGPSGPADCKLSKPCIPLEQLLAHSTKSCVNPCPAPTADLSSWWHLPDPRTIWVTRQLSPSSPSQQCWALHAHLGVQPWGIAPLS